MRKAVEMEGDGSVTVSGRADGSFEVWIDGILIGSDLASGANGRGPWHTAMSAGAHCVAVRVVDDVADPSFDYIYADVNAELA